MRALFIALLSLGLGAPAAAAYEEEGLAETVSAAEEVRGQEEEETQPLVQESDEDLAAFVTDYIRKDIQLKGAFFLEERVSKKVYRLELASVDPKPAADGNGARSVTARFKDAAGKKYTVRFWVQTGPWGGLDIFKLELTKAPAGEQPKAKTKKRQ